MAVSGLSELSMENEPAKAGCPKCSQGASEARRRGTDTSLLQRDITIALPDHDGRDCITDEQWDSSVIRNTSSGSVTAHFGKLKSPLIDFIRGSNNIVGCVAWLTELDVLDALSKVDTAIVVQKEDFLRPDSGPYKKNRLQSKYAKVSNRWERQWFPHPLGLLSYLSDPTVDGVRCAGNSNAEKKPASPRMHHKFLVRFDFVSSDEGLVAVPTAVWTGSFNFSHNAGNSLENAVIIEDTNIAEAYFIEFCRVAAISEPLDWESEYVAPQWRVGS